MSSFRREGGSSEEKKMAKMPHMMTAILDWVCLLVGRCS